MTRIRALLVAAVAGVLVLLGVAPANAAAGGLVFNNTTAPLSVTLTNGQWAVLQPGWSSYTYGQVRSIYTAAGRCKWISVNYGPTRPYSGGHTYTSLGSNYRVQKTGAC